MRTRSLRSQRGIVLVTAILIVVIIAGVAATLGLAQQVWLRQTENFVDRAQADSLRYSAIHWVAILLVREDKDKQVDSLDELWAKQLPPLPSEGGLITVSISDAQSLFNLNNLVRNKNVPSTEDIGIFQRLLSAQGIDPALTQALIDWIDSGMDAGPGGAEDPDYLSLPTPYRAANQPLTSIDELHLIKGFTPAVVEKLRPLVTVLPNPTSINVNTVIEPVLAAMFVNPPAGLDAVLRNRANQPFKTIDDFKKQFPPGTPFPNGIGTNTGYFLVNIGVRVGRLDRRSEVLINRPASGAATALWYRTNPVPIQPKTDEKT